MGPAPPSSPPERPLGTEPEAADFAEQVLRALQGVSARSFRAEAEVSAALHNAGLPTDPLRVRDALSLLRIRGCITNLVPLWDGGLLVTVTGLGIRPAPFEWLPPGDGSTE